MQQRGTHVRWRDARNAWVAQRQNKYKTFKPDDVANPVALQEAHDRATRWAAGEDDVIDGAQDDRDNKSDHGEQGDQNDMGDDQDEQGDKSDQGDHGGQVEQDDQGEQSEQDVQDGQGE